MYRTGIPNVQVLLLEAKEEFLNAKHLEVSDMEEEILIESELRGALNSIELSLENLYQNLNERACPKHSSRQIWRRYMIGKAGHCSHM